jgi:hypothetical protein
MSQTIYESDRMVMYHDEKQQAIQITWKKECGNILDKVHAPDIEKIRTIIKETAPSNILANMVNCQYLLTPDTGPGFENPLYTIFSDLPPSRIALVIPKNLFVNASFDATRAAEKASPGTNLKYFYNPEKAWEWLSNY